MREKYLNGKIANSSLAALTPEDIAKLRTLFKDERKTLLGMRVHIVKCVES